MVTTTIGDSYFAVSISQLVFDLADAPTYLLNAFAVPVADLDKLLPHPPDVGFDIDNRPNLENS
jgi:hypothetical protein